MNERKKINPLIIKFFSTLAVGLIVMAVVFILTNYVMKKSLEDAESRYTESCSEVLEGYSNAIHYYLENYHTSLSSIYYRELFERGDKKEILNWLVENVPFIHPEFFAAYYVDIDSKQIYISQGAVISYDSKPYIEEADFSEAGFYISDIFESEYVNSPVFMFEEPYYNEKGELKGILGAAVRIYQLEKVTDKIKIGDDCTVLLIDRKGRFLIHNDKSYIGKNFVPLREEYKNITSELIAQSEASVVETENVSGEIIDLFFSKVKHCGWTLAIAFPKSNYFDLFRQQSAVRLRIIIISFIALLVLIAMETALTQFFYHRQMIDNIYDPLTNLWTRQHFEEMAEKTLCHNPGGKYMLIESDIREFKLINKNYGEDVGDKLIYYYSKLLNKITSRRGGIIGRGYADRFYSLLKINNVRRSMNAFRAEMNDLFAEIKNYEIPFSPKFGITFVSPGKRKDVTVKALIGQASFAKNIIKNDMIAQYSIYNSKLLDKVNEERFMESQMETALANKEFFVMYQPKMSLTTDKIVGAEALVRWKSENKGIITPDKFIPLFERNNFIKKLDFYVYEEVFKFISRQLEEGRPVVPVSLNMSRNHNKPEKFVHDFMSLFNQFNIPPELVQIEIVERSFMDNSTLETITKLLHKKGFSVAMDDFGSGESSLNMLAKIPVDVLKFDREFLVSSTKEDGNLDEDSAKFIQVLINLSKNLDKETVFEGVETELQRDFLRSINCDQVQGYFYSRPLVEQDFIEFIAKHI